MKQATLHSARTSKPRELNEYECAQNARQAYRPKRGEGAPAKRADSRSIYAGRAKEAAASTAGLRARICWAEENRHRLLRVFA